MNDIRASLCLEVGFPCICLYLWVIASLLFSQQLGRPSQSLSHQPFSCEAGFHKGDLDELDKHDHVLTVVSWRWRGATHDLVVGCADLQVSCPWDKKTQGEADISMVTGFTQQTSWLVFCEASKTGRKTNPSPPESRCLSLTILLAVISTFWNKDDGLRLASSFSNAKSNLCRSKQPCLLLPGLRELCRTMQVTEASGVSFSSHHSLEAYGLVTWNQRLIRTEESLKGQLIQPPTQDMPSRTNHPHCRLLIYVAIQGSYVFSGKMTHPQGVTKLRIVSWAVMGKGGCTLIPNHYN